MSIWLWLLVLYVCLWIVSLLLSYKFGEEDCEEVFFCGFIGLVLGMFIVPCTLISHGYYHRDLESHIKADWINIVEIEKSQELKTVLIEVLGDHKLTWADVRKLKDTREEVHNSRIVDKVDNLKFLGE